jgi:hypothetical protein
MGCAADLLACTSSDDLMFQNYIELLMFLLTPPVALINISDREDD